MRIGIAHSYFSVMGGAEATTLSLIEALKKTSHYTTLYTLIPPEINETNNFKIKKINFKEKRFFKNYQRYKGGRKEIFYEARNDDVLVIIGSGFMFEKSDLPRVILYFHAFPETSLKIAYAKFKGWPKIYFKKKAEGPSKTI